MNFAETMLFYATIGLAVAAARWLNERPTTAIARLGLVPATTLFWPMYLPLVLTKQGFDDGPPLPAPHDDLDRAIAQVESELNAALADLDDGPETVMRAHVGQLRELRPALNAEAERIRRMDRVLTDERAATPLEDVAVNDRERKSRQTRQENMQRLADLARRSRVDLLTTLAWIRELTSMIHLAKFTGEPSARAEELVAQIAAAVESLSRTTTKSA